MCRCSVLGVLLSFGLAACSPSPAQLGERIFAYGEGMESRLPYSQGPGWLAHGRFGCAACHGAQGEGRSVRAGAVAGSAPPLTAAALKARGYGPRQLQRAIVTGIAIDGREFSYYMPRWQLGAAELDALLRYLSTL